MEQWAQKKFTCYVEREESQKDKTLMGRNKGCRFCIGFEAEPAFVYP